MACFTLNFTEIQKGFAEVEAENKDEAEEMALELYNDGAVNWTQSSISEITAENKITVVDAPEVSLAEDEQAGEVLLKFYRALGWNGEDMLDPNKVRTTNAVYNRLYEIMFDKCPDPVGVGMMMVNRGPSTDDYIPKEKVYLYDGWTTPANLGGKIDESR